MDDELNLSCSSDSGGGWVDDGRGRGCRGGEGDDGFSVVFRGLAGLPRRERFAHRAEYPLIQSIEYEGRGDDEDVLRQGKAEVGNHEVDECGRQGDAGIELMAIAGWRPFKTRRRVA